MAREQTSEAKQNRLLNFAFLNALNVTSSTNITNCFDEVEAKHKCKFDSKKMSIENPQIFGQMMGYSHIEKYMDARGVLSVLCVYGDALDSLDCARAQSDTNVISFQYVSIDKVQRKFVSEQCEKAKAFENIERVVFSHNDLHTFKQLSWIGDSKLRVKELVILHNRILSNNLLRSFIATSLPVRFEPVH